MPVGPCRFTPIIPRQKEDVIIVLFALTALIRLLYWFPEISYPL
jgi:hypothetical protein